MSKNSIIEFFKIIDSYDPKKGATHVGNSYAEFYGQQQAKYIKSFIQPCAIADINKKKVFVRKTK